MKKFKLVFNDLNPVGQGRPRFSTNPQYLQQQRLIAANPRWKKRLPKVPKGFARDPKSSKLFKQTIGYLAKAQYKDKLIDYPINVKMLFYRQVLKSASKTTRQKMLSGQIRPTKRPDVDNYVKGTLDALTGVVWKDDNLIVGITSEKYFAEEPHIEIEIEEVDAECQKK